MAQSYVWRVTVYGEEYGTWYNYRNDTRLFNNKISAMNYATKMEKIKNKCGNFLQAKVEKWFGD